MQDFNKLVRRAVKLIIQHMAVHQMRIPELPPTRQIIRLSVRSYSKEERDMNTRVTTLLSMLVEKL